MAKPCVKFGYQTQVCRTRHRFTTVQFRHGARLQANHAESCPAACRVADPHSGSSDRHLLNSRHSGRRPRLASDVPEFASPRLARLRPCRPRLGPWQTRRTADSTCLGTPNMEGAQTSRGVTRLKTSSVVQRDPAWV
ncbi:hypothetical protein FH972_017414 [Carpinus fangiana]|uniref:Uncharacterized protein n=1 Tax=Carpinus fangiana TaxID=176857 RepID=A0A5N6RJ47_9ROSI|nr:hypothetical protein FH972_017414 [Carpinus fangiana]